MTAGSFFELSDLNPEAPFVSVVVPARNAEETLADCLASLVRTDYPPGRREILVVDNASTDRTAEIARRFPVTVLFEPQRGPSSARNRGIAQSRGDIIAFTDADCVVSTGWLQQLAGGFDREEVWAVAGEMLSFPPAKPAERYTTGRKSHWQRSALTSRQPFPITANVAFRRCTFEKIGLFDPLFLTAQDKDFGWRFFGAGLCLKYSPRAIVLHHHRSSGWGLFKQHARWGYGASLLHAKYRFNWSIGDELTKYRELAAAAVNAAGAFAAWAFFRGSKKPPFQAYFELLRRLGLRAGALVGLVDRRARRTLAGRSLEYVPPTGSQILTDKATSFDGAAAGV